MSKPVFGAPLPIQIVAVVEGGCLREIYSLDVPMEYTTLNFDDDCIDEDDVICEIGAQDAVVEKNMTLEELVEKLRKEYT